MQILGIVVLGAALPGCAKFSSLDRHHPQVKHQEAAVANFTGLLIGLAAFAGWCQHLFTCFNEQLWGFLIAGAIFFPIAIIHGWGIWFGWWH
jgi:hypothetical protein